MKKEYFFLLIFLLGWCYFSYQIFFHKTDPAEDSPVLRARLGTILWHSSGKDGPSHTYCYYPKGSTQYTNKGGEYIIKREDSEDCSGWYGQVTFNEGYWVSEREKIWWSEEQKMQEELASIQHKVNNI